MASFQQVKDQYCDLLETFLNCAEAFNERDWATLGNLFHDNVATSSIAIKGDTETARGKPQVLQWLRDYVATRDDVPKFTPVPPICVDIRSGTVSGTAIWTDIQADKRITNDVVRYSFIFTLEMSTNRWLCVIKQAWRD